ncbi:hypothetical protein HMPREF6745_0040 [Prevotella sp. oral taxon 472 str. F0295]|nr:hypothetical protein HMPREF6745_0040 [Prevotella sp. oral taxon 472 str. F0295]
MILLTGITPNCTAFRAFLKCPTKDFTNDKPMNLKAQETFDG